jgi:hypothetical protein
LRIKEEKQQKGEISASKRRSTYPRDTQITMQGSDNFIITLDMLFIDQETTQKPVKDFETLDLAVSQDTNKGSL